MFNTFEKTLKQFTPPMLQISAFEISDRSCHHRSDNYIILPIYVGPRNMLSCFVHKRLYFFMKHNTYFCNKTVAANRQQCISRMVSVLWYCNFLGHKNSFICLAFYDFIPKITFALENTII